MIHLQSNQSNLVPDAQSASCRPASYLCNLIVAHNGCIHTQEADSASREAAPVSLRMAARFVSAFMPDASRCAAPDICLKTSSFWRTMTSMSDASIMMAVPLWAAVLPVAAPPPAGLSLLPPPAAFLASVMGLLLSLDLSGPGTVADAGSSPLVPLSAC
jgi:hypothetical protein